ncbi:MAG: FecR domain-containing protein [Bdellovibrionales bacterium]|nr:FecR domain-containing protein [Bdellovibrionales bacterium]
MYLKTLIFSFTLLTLPSLLYANSGIIKVLKGEVYIVSGKTNLKAQAKMGQKVFASDTVITSKDSRLKVVMIDGNEINVSPETRVKISKYEYENNGKKKNVLLNVLKGKVRSKVKQKYDGDKNKFQVKTKTAVAGVRGTDFLASYNPQQNSSNVITFEGRVEFGLPGANGSIVNPVAVTAGQTVSQIGQSIPSAPQNLPATELASIDTETDAEKAPEGERLPARQQQETNSKDEPKEKEPKSKDPAAKKEPAATDKNTNKKQPQKSINQNAKNKRPSADGDRNPANLPTEEGTAKQRQPAAVETQPSMMIDSDLPTAENNNFIEDFPTNDTLMPIGATDPIGEYDRLPVCEFCNDVINTNDAYLRIRVKK